MLAFHPSNHTMFDFFTKFFSGRNQSKSVTPSARVAASTDMMRGEAKQAGEINQKQEQQDQQRQVWKQKIDAAIGNEALVIEMLLACDFADGRLYAAQQVHSKQGLEQIKNAFKKSDKRVTKLAVTRLDEIDQQEQNGQSHLAPAERQPGITNVVGKRL